jgi:uncharacterized UPF0146 family protein
MIRELFPYLTTSCPQYVRHMDYLSEAIAMRGRYQHNSAAWQPHLGSTRRFVLATAEKCGNRNKAVILGAGLLLDVPLEELSSMFREVVLLDIVFLPEARRSVKQFSNVQLVQNDVTNLAKKLYENIHQGIRELPEAVPRVPDIDHNTGLVVSLNILSQLWVVPRAYALRKLPCLDEEQVNDWCRQVVESHYGYLCSLPGDVCLVADHEFVKRDCEGNIVSRGSTVAGLELPQPDSFWSWDIVPGGEGRQYLSKELIVGAWQLR